MRIIEPASSQWSPNTLAQYLQCLRTHLTRYVHISESSTSTHTARSNNHKITFPQLQIVTAILWQCSSDYSLYGHSLFRKFNTATDLVRLKRFDLLNPETKRNKQITNKKHGHYHTSIIKHICRTKFVLLVGWLTWLTNETKCCQLPFIYLRVKFWRRIVAAVLQMYRFRVLLKSLVSICSCDMTNK